MKHGTGKIMACLLLGMMITGSLMLPAAASEDDNSLYSLGLMTDGAELEQEVQYGVFEYDVIVPAGTDELELDPVPSNENAQISEITGTDLDDEGNGTVLVTVTAPNGDPFTYTIHVTSLDDGTEVQTEAPTEPVTEKKKKKKPKETEAQTEEKLYVEVPRDTVTQAQNTITELQNEIIEYRENVNLFQKIMYVLLAVSIVFLFIIINMILRNRDLKAELKEYRSLGYSPSGKDKNPPSQGGSSGQDKTPKETAPESAPPSRKERHSVYYEKAPLDVTPQTSTRAKRLPEYEPSAPETKAAQEPAPKEQPTPPPAPASGNKKNSDGVQVDMIDL